MQSMEKYCKLKRCNRKIIFSIRKVGILLKQVEDIYPTYEIDIKMADLLEHALLRRNNQRSESWTAILILMSKK